MSTMIQGGISVIILSLLRELFCTMLLIIKLAICYLRDRPFNLKGGGGYGLLFRSEILFRTTRELE